jgi:hypothetical protein
VITSSINDVICCQIVEIALKHKTYRYTFSCTRTGFSLAYIFEILKACNQLILMFPTRIFVLWGIGDFTAPILSAIFGFFKMSKTIIFWIINRTKVSDTIFQTKSGSRNRVFLQSELPESNKSKKYIWWWINDQ